MARAPYPQPLANASLGAVAAVDLDPALRPRLGPPICLALPLPDPPDWEEEEDEEDEEDLEGEDAEGEVEEEEDDEDEESWGDEEDAADLVMEEADDEDDDEPDPDAILWLLSGPEPHLLLAVGRTYYWLVDLNKGEAIAHAYVNEHTVAAFLPDGRYCYRPGTVLEVRDPIPADPDDDFPGQWALLPNFGQPTQCLAFAPVGAEVVLALQNFGNPEKPNAVELRLLRSPLTASMLDIIWELPMEAQGWPSPALSDGTIVLHLGDGLHLINPDGSEGPVIPALLAPRLVSVDAADQIWGFAPGDDDNLELVGLNTRGERLPGVSILGEPVQPPMPLPDGSVVVVTGLGVMVAQAGRIIWEKALPGGGKMATGTRDLHLLVKGGDMLTLLRGGPHRVWSVRVPGGEAITANPVVTADGGVHVAAGLKIYSLMR